MKVEIRLYREFHTNTGLFYGHFCVLKAVLEGDKSGVKLLAQTDNNLLLDLKNEGFIEVYEDVSDGVTHTRAKPTEKASLYHIAEEYSAVVEAIHEDFNRVRKSHRKRVVTLSKTDRNRIIEWLKAGKTIDDFKTVHTYWFEKWVGDPQFEKYLTMQTLYKKSGKSTFEDKLSQAKEDNPSTTPSNFRLS